MRASDLFLTSLFPFVLILLHSWVSFRLGTWKIVAHYEGDKEHATSLEFQVQKFGECLHFILTVVSV